MIDFLHVEIEPKSVKGNCKASSLCWTTTLDIEHGYAIAIRNLTGRENTRKLIVFNDNVYSAGSHEGLFYQNGQYGGCLKYLPLTDFIKYNLLKKNNIDVSDETLSELLLVLKME